MDIAIEIMREDVPSVLGDFSWRAGDISKVRPALKTHVDDPRSTAKNKAQIIITGVPDREAARMLQVLKRPEYEAGDVTFDAEDKIVEATRKPRIVNRSEWQVPLGSIPPGRRNALLNPPFAIKVSWAQFKGSLAERKRDRKRFDEVGR